jgi:hypothetical protein
MSFSSNKHLQDCMAVGVLKLKQTKLQKEINYAKVFKYSTLDELKSQYQKLEVEITNIQNKYN